MENKLIDYENTIILRPGLTAATIEELTNKMKEVISKDGEVGNIEQKGVQTLAYPIEKNNQGIYIFSTFKGSNETVAQLERTFRLSENVMRFLTIKTESEKKEA